MIKAKPQNEHRWLEKLAGEWTVSSDMPSPDGEGTQTNTWTERVRLLEGLWLVAEGEGTMPGTGEAIATMMTLGYDPAKERFVGNWLGTMMTHMWVYEGTLDAAGKVLTLDTLGPSFDAQGNVVPGKTARYQDIITIEDDDHRVLSSQVLSDDGTWQPIMKADYRRKA